MVGGLNLNALKRSIEKKLLENPSSIVEVEFKGSPLYELKDYFD
jgi:hypothetical protein